MGAPDTGTCDEIKEFCHEGEQGSAGLTDIKNMLGIAADKPPSALDLKGTVGISPLVIEVASRIKQEQEQLRIQRSSTHALYTGGPTAPNVNVVTMAGSSNYPRPTWTAPLLLHSTLASTLASTQPAYQHYYPTFQYTQQFAPVASTPNQTPPEVQTKTKGGKGKKKSTHIKKPLNAFMLYMKEMRAKVVQEYTLKESAAINQILGKRWHALDRSEQARFYELARRERALHMQMYPNWSARSNYAATNKKKRKRDKNTEQDAGSPKKCRARYGLDKQSSWCKPCRRKKKCVRYLQGEDADCKDGKCEADNHKASCPAAHEPGCSVRGTVTDCDCNTHTCGYKAPEEKDCTCNKEDETNIKTEPFDGKSPNVVIKSAADSLHLASVANLSLTRESAPVYRPHVYLQTPVAQPVMGDGVQVGYTPANVLSHLPYQ